MLVVGIIFLSLTLLGFTRVGVRAERRPDGRSRVILRAGVLRFDLGKLLQKSRKTGKGRKAAKGRALNPMDYLGVLGPVLRALLRGVRVDKLLGNLTIAGADDPCDAALLFGRLHMVWGALRSVLLGCVRVKRERVRIAMDFELDKTRWDGEVCVTISLGRSFAVLLSAAWAVINNKTKEGGMRTWKTKEASRN